MNVSVCKHQVHIPHGIVLCGKGVDKGHVCNLFWCSEVGGPEY